MPRKESTCQKSHPRFCPLGRCRIPRPQGVQIYTMHYFNMIAGVRGDILVAASNMGGTTVVDFIALGRDRGLRLAAAVNFESVVVLLVQQLHLRERPRPRGGYLVAQ